MVGPGVEAFGLTKPANTVGGDFYDILPQPDGTVLVALGDVAGKASPAALLMALLLAIFARSSTKDATHRARAAPEHSGRATRAGLPIHHVVPGVVQSPPQAASSSSAGQTPPLLRRKMIHRKTDERRYRARHVRRQHVSSR